MKKILFVIPQLYGGGAERVTAVLANELCREAGNEIHLVTYRVNPADYPLDNRVIRHHPERDFSGSALLMPAKLSFLGRTIRKIAPDCVISLSGPSQTALLAMILPWMRIPWILSERNDPNRYPGNRLLRLSRLVCYTLCDGVVFQTKDARDYFPGWIRKKGTVICNPLSGKLPPRFEGIRDRRIVNWCRLNSQKNLDLLIDAFEDVSRLYPDCSLHIYGDGSERDRITMKIQSMGLQDRAVLHGYTRSVHEQVQSASLFVSSSDYEGMSNSMLEAIAMGIPSICTDCPIGGAREIIEDGINGILVPVRDRNAMKNAMARVLSDPVLAESLSENGFRLREKLSSRSIAGQWIGFMDEVIHQRRDKM